MKHLQQIVGTGGHRVREIKSDTEKVRLRSSSIFGGLTT